MLMIQLKVRVLNTGKETFQKTIYVMYKAPLFSDDREMLGHATCLQKLSAALFDGRVPTPKCGKTGPRRLCQQTSPSAGISVSDFTQVCRKEAGRKEEERHRHIFPILRNVTFLNIEGIIRAVDTHAGTSSSPRISYTRQGRGRAREQAKAPLVQSGQGFRWVTEILRGTATDRAVPPSPCLTRNHL